MNNDQTNAFLRTLLTFAGTAIGTYLVSHGYLNADQLSTAAGALTALAGAAATLAPIAISLYKTYSANSAKAKLASVAAMPEVTSVNMAPAAQALADSVPSSKVAVPVAKVGAFLLACVLGVALFGAPPAEAAGLSLASLFAQIKSVGTKLQTPDQIAGAILANISGAGTPDLAAAIAAAQKSNNTVSLPCWTAIKGFNDNIAALPQASTLPKVHIALDIEILTELVIALQPNSPVITGCSALANFQKVAATNMVAGIVTGATSLAALAPVIP
jgi:hypothetical protein